MGNRRMFHSDITESDAFLDLPFSAQALYLHLGMAADDDGFVNAPKRIVRLIGASIDDLDLLVEKRFLLRFPDYVVLIKHWRLANSLKADRLKPPRYPEYAAIVYIKPNRVYTDHPVPGAVTLYENRAKSLESKWNPDGILREGKVREGNIREGKVVEAEADGIQLAPVPLSAEELAEAAEDKKLKLFGGELGKNVVFLSSEQINSLLEKIGLEAFDYYVDKLASYILKTGAKPKSHYSTILKWYAEDQAT